MLIKAFGVNDFGLVDFPVKISSVKVSRLENWLEGGCEWGFPHGYETNNATSAKNWRNWKHHRKQQWFR